MLNLDQFMNIRFLQKQGHSVRQIARMTGHSRNTVRKLLRAKITLTPAPRVRGSKLDDHRDYLTERWQAHRLSAVRLLAEIQPRGFTGSVKIVRRFLAQLGAAHRTDPRLTVRFETPPAPPATTGSAPATRDEPSPMPPARPAPPPLPPGQNPAPRTGRANATPPAPQPNPPRVPAAESTSSSRRLRCRSDSPPPVPSLRSNFPSSR